MKSTLLSLAAVATAFLNTGCLSNSGGWGSSSMGPQVQIPPAASLRLVERTLLPDFSDALRNAGYQPVSSPAEYRATFNIAEGPINAVTSMQLTRAGQSVAMAQARQGGFTKVLQGSKYAEQSFYRCLQEFTDKLPRQRGTGGYQNYPSNSRNTYDNQGQGQGQGQGYQGNSGYGNNGGYDNNHENHNHYGAGESGGNDNSGYDALDRPQNPQGGSNWRSGW